MPETDFTIRPDTSYPVIFHSPGLEPWILGLLLEFKPSSVLDVGCSYGFWGFIVRKYTSSVCYIVGFDLDNKRVLKAKTVYDDVIVADARLPPFRERSFDTVLAIEVLHSLGRNEAIGKTIKLYKTIAERLLVVALPWSNHKLCKLLRNLNLKVYRYVLRGLILMSRDGVYSMYETRLWKIAKCFFKILVRIFPWIVNKGYVLAIWHHK